MTAMSILAMAMVICLFGGYVDSPNEQRITRQCGPSARRSIQSRSDEKETMIMNPNAIPLLHGLLDLVRITQSRDRYLVGSFRGIPLSSLKRDATMKTKNLKQSNATRSQRLVSPTRRRHDPMLVFNMSIFNSPKSRGNAQPNVCLRF